MMTLAYGEVVFSVNDLTFDQLSMNLKFNWAKQVRLNHYPNLEYAGIESETMTIRGITFVNYKSAMDAIKQLTEMAKSARPYFLIGLDGLVYGKWVLDGINKEILEGCKLSYNLSLIRYDMKHKKGI
ncbi:phage tail protein [Thiotrichales bacterium 19S11-10]|nr:phage tail protein [Thiotrichales bacterium 19S11-10]